MNRIKLKFFEDYIWIVKKRLKNMAVTIKSFSEMLKKDVFRQKESQGSEIVLGGAGVALLKFRA